MSAEIESSRVNAFGEDQESYQDFKNTHYDLYHWYENEDIPPYNYKQQCLEWDGNSDTTPPSQWWKLLWLDYGEVLDESFHTEATSTCTEENVMSRQHDEHVWEEFDEESFDVAMNIPNEIVTSSTEQGENDGGDQLDVSFMSLSED
jgi:hypothetical protein